MKRLLLAALLAAALVLPSLADGAASRQARIAESFAPTATGAVVTDAAGTSRLLLDVKNALAGAGSASLTVTPTAGAFVAKGSLYDGQGSLRLRLVLRFAPDTTGAPSAISGTGKVITGTGIYTHARGSLNVAGTRSATGALVLKLKGSVTHDFVPPVAGSGRGQ
jgi:hypothetical protein